MLNAISGTSVNGAVVKWKYARPFVLIKMCSPHLSALLPCGVTLLPYTPLLSTPPHFCDLYDWESEKQKKGGKSKSLWKANCGNISSKSQQLFKKGQRAQRMCYWHFCACVYANLGNAISKIKCPYYFIIWSENSHKLLCSIFCCVFSKKITFNHNTKTKKSNEERESSAPTPNQNFLSSLIFLPWDSHQASQSFLFLLRGWVKWPVVCLPTMKFYKFFLMLLGLSKAFWKTISKHFRLERNFNCAHELRHLFSLFR